MRLRHGVSMLVAMLLSVSCLARADQVAGSPTAESLHKRVAELHEDVNKLDKDWPLKALPMYLPGVTTNIPTGFGAAPGTLVAGFGARTLDWKPSGDIGFLYGFGDSVRSVGANVSLSLFELHKIPTRGALSVHLFHRVSKGFSVAAGYENGATWGPVDSCHSAYVVGTQVIGLKHGSTSSFSRLYVTLGAGDGRFQSEWAYAANRDRISVFGGLATNLSPCINAFTEWTGKATNIGLSIAPKNGLPLFFTPAIDDIANQTHRGFGLSLGISYVIVGGKH